MIRFAFDIFDADHVGWNTIRRGNRREPTFKNARYIVPRDEVHRLRAAVGTGLGRLLHGAYDDSILPILEAGLDDEVDLPHEIAPKLCPEAAPGHTARMAMLLLSTDGQEAVFLADANHHPLEFADVELVSNSCTDP